MPDVNVNVGVTQNKITVITSSDDKITVISGGFVSSLGIGTVSTLAPDADATATITNEDGGPKLNIGIPGGSGSTSLAGLTDVEITAPDDSQILQYNLEQDKWLNTTVSFDASTQISDAINALNLGDVATHDAAEFTTPDQVSTAISDFVTALSFGDIITHDVADFDPAGAATSAADAALSEANSYTDTAISELGSSGASGYDIYSYDDFITGDTSLSGNVQLPSGLSLVEFDLIAAGGGGASGSNSGSENVTGYGGGPGGCGGRMIRKVHLDPSLQYNINYHVGMGGAGGLPNSTIPSVATSYQYGNNGGQGSNSNISITKSGGLSVYSFGVSGGAGGQFGQPGRPYNAYIVPGNINYNYVVTTSNVYNTFVVGPGYGYYVAFGQEWSDHPPIYPTDYGSMPGVAGGHSNNGVNGGSGGPRTNSHDGYAFSGSDYYGLCNSASDINGEDGAVLTNTYGPGAGGNGGGAGASGGIGGAGSRGNNGLIVVRYLG